MHQAQHDMVKIASYVKRAVLAQQVDELRQQLRVTQLSAFKKEAKQRMAVLRKLGHIDAAGGW